MAFVWAGNITKLGANIDDDAAAGFCHNSPDGLAEEKTSL